MGPNMTRPEKDGWPIAGERRTATRFSCALNATYRSTAEAADQASPAGVRDISRKGVGLVTGRAFGLGSLLAVQFVRPGGSVVRSVEAQVVYTHLDPRGWIHGCQFTHPLGEDDMAELLR
jgi:hypothetical protein